MLPEVRMAVHEISNDTIAALKLEGPGKREPGGVDPVHDNTELESASSNNDDNNFKHHLGITAQKAIMELASESQSFRSNNNPWKVITVTK